jgi:RNA polymerase sigma-70 factor, ECF subfamily
MLPFAMSVNFVNFSDSEESLLRAVALKDASAMEVLYKRLSSAVFAFAYRRINDETLADEVVNDTMMQVWKSAADFAHQSTVKTWVLGIAKNKSLDVLRTRSRALARETDVSDEELNQVADNSPDAYTLILSKQRAHHLVECFGQLSTEQQSCLHLFIVEGMSLNEIAQVLDVPLNTVATRIHHAKRRLKEKLESLFGKEDV